MKKDGNSPADSPSPPPPQKKINLVHLNISSVFPLVEFSLCLLRLLTTKQPLYYLCHREQVNVFTMFLPFLKQPSLHNGNSQVSYNQLPTNLSITPV